MDIALSFDKGFSMQAAVTMASISISNAKSGITFHLLTDNLDDNLKDRICFSLKHDSHKAIFYTIDKSLLKDCPVNKDLACPSLAKYYRLLLPKILPQTVERVLYLDCDIIVTDTLAPLFQIEMKDKAIGVISDQKPYVINNYNRLGIELEDGYFNSGVILFDLLNWRNNDYTLDVFSYIRKNRSSLVWEDQDALNKIFSKNKIYLPLQYNLQNDMLYDKNELYWKNREELINAIKNPVCIHFCGSKPWEKECRHPWRGDWEYVLTQTAWNGFVLRKKSVMQRIIIYIKKMILRYMTFHMVEEKFSFICNPKTKHFLK